MSNLLPLVLFTIPAMITPGPNNFMAMNSGLYFGIRKSLRHISGISIGYPIMGLLVSLGLGRVFVDYPWIKDTLKILGSAYMLYLAWKTLVASYSKDAQPLAKPFGFFQAMAFQWVNPKAWLMTIGAISIFSLTTNYFSNALTISLVFFVIGLPSIFTWLVFGNFLQHVLKEDKHRRIFNVIMAICLAASVVMILLD